MKYKLLVTDLDGTLLDVNGQVRDRDREAIAKLLHNGVPVAIATGRMYSGTRHVAHDVGLTGPVGCVDGSHIVNAGDDRDLLLKTIEATAAERLFGILNTFRPTTFVFSEDTLFHDERGAPYLSYVQTWSRRPRALADTLAHFGDGGGAVAGLVSLGNEEQILGAHGQILRETDDHVQAAPFPLRSPGFEGLWGMVVRAAGVSKATAVDWIAAHYGIDASEVVVVGDWLNDISMFKRAGRSFAMAQSPEEVKAVATDELEASALTGGGIAEAAERAGML